MKYRTSAVRPIREYLADSLLGSDRITLFHQSGRDCNKRNIYFMADKDIKQPVQFEYGRHLAVENARAQALGFLDVITRDIQQS